MLGICEAVLITSLTTMVGFGSLMIASHRGLQSLGRVLTIGVGCCLFASLVMLPAVLAWTTRNRQDTPEDTEGSRGQRVLPERVIRRDPAHGIVNLDGEVAIIARATCSDEFRARHMRRVRRRQWHIQEERLAVIGPGPLVNVGHGVFRDLW